MKRYTRKAGMMYEHTEGKWVKYKEVLQLIEDFEEDRTKLGEELMEMEDKYLEARYSEKERY